MHTQLAARDVSSSRNDWIVALKVINKSWLWAGLHLEGPFLSVKKKGAHPERFIRKFHSGGIDDLTEVYGSLDNVAIVTLAPELEHSQSVVRELTQRGVTVSLGRVDVCVCVRFWPCDLLMTSDILTKVTPWPACLRRRRLFSTGPPSSPTSSMPCRPWVTSVPPVVGNLSPPGWPQLVWCSSTIGTLVSWVCWPAIRSQRGGPSTTAWSLTGSTPTQQPCVSPTGRILQVGAAVDDTTQDRFA